MGSATFTIAGRYRVERRLGVGGMSTVHLALDQRLERYVALKLLAEHLADDPTFVSRFRREALSAARLVHPNIVQVFDFGLDEGRNQYFIVMERVDGRSCAELLRDRGHMDVAQAVEIVAQACRGLDYAHRNGVVHRDVKPGNLLVSKADVVKLADFGIARATDQSSITQVGSVLGTAAYLAPEQARGEEAGPRADLYSLGVVAYQLLSGRLPYEATSLAELALKQQRQPPVPLQQLNPRVSPELGEAVLAALSIDKRDRPEDALQLAEAIRAGVHGVSAPAGGGPAREPGTGATRVLGQRERATEATRIATPRTAAAQTARRPRTVPAGAPVSRFREPPEPTRTPRRRPPGRVRRALRLTALMLVVIVVAVVAAVVAAGTSTTAVHTRRVIATDAQSAITQVGKIIGDNTAK
jgi:predicted Ser/Thr protein kinase